jgi:hypothetical protein
MPVTRYLFWVGGVLLALLFVADACLPELPFRRSAGVPSPVIRVHSERKWPERIVLDTSAPMPHVAVVASPTPTDPVRPTAIIIPDRTREALAQLQAPTEPQMQAKPPKQPEAHRQQKMAKRHVARPPVRPAHQWQYAWFGGRMWW